jgi:signal transduction histidine kinase
MKTGTVLMVAHGLVLAVGIVFGAVAVSELQRTSARLELLVSDSARTVIEVERSRAASDRLGLAIRSYLLTQDAEFRGAVVDAAAQFRERLRALSERLRGSPSAPLVQRISELDAEGQSNLKELLGGSLSQAESVLALTTRGQPLRVQLDALFEQLSQTEEWALKDATHEATLAATRASQRLSGLAIIALCVASALTVSLARASRLLARSRGELEVSIQTLEQVNQDLDAFVGRSAHDLRNVISPLGLLAELLEQKHEDPAAVRRSAVRLKRVSLAAERLIDSYLTFARSAQPANPAASVRVRGVIADVVEDLAPVAAQKQARLEVQGDDAAVLCSQSFLHTMLLNLVGNGLKYLDGGAHREVSVSVRVSPEWCEIAVRDGGPGIPTAAKDEIFKPFYRLPGVKAPGTGLGLATVARLVKAHRGQLSVQTAPGQGSTFTMRLPRADVPGASEPTTASLPAAVSDA